MYIYCFRRTSTITSKEICIQCQYKRKCRPFQLWMQPEFSFVFKHGGDSNSVFDIHTDIRDTLDALFPSEYRLLRRMAMHQLPGVTDRNSPLVRIKMFELLKKSVAETEG